MRSKFIYLFLLSAVLSCGSRKSITPTNGKLESLRKNTVPVIAEKAYDIVDYAEQFEGTRYKYGGTTKKGMDCSGLVMTAFLSEDIPLPRSTKDMAGSGDWIDLKTVQVGDLLFFATRNNSRQVNHVGIVTESRPGYVQFIHSTNSRGVIKSTLDEKYWYFAFVQARRVL